MTASVPWQGSRVAIVKGAWKQHKGRHLHLGHALLEDGGQQHEVVVLHPHHVPRAVVAQHDIPEALVRRLVRRPLELQAARAQAQSRSVLLGKRALRLLTDGTMLLLRAHTVIVAAVIPQPQLQSAGRARLHNEHNSIEPLRSGVCKSQRKTCGPTCSVRVSLSLESMLSGT